MSIHDYKHKKHNSRGENQPEIPKTKDKALVGKFKNESNVCLCFGIRQIFNCSNQLMPTKQCENVC